MLVGFPPIFVTNTNIIFGYNFGAYLMEKEILESLSGIKEKPKACSTHLFTYCKFNRESVFQILGLNDTF